MTGKAKTNMADLARKLTERKRLVTVDDQTFELKVPSIAAADELRQWLTKQGEDGKASMLGCVGRAVAACIEDLDLDTATRLVLVAGGETGELATAAMELAGLHRLTSTALAEGAADSPT